MKKNLSPYLKNWRTGTRGTGAAPLGRHRTIGDMEQLTEGEGIEVDEGSKGKTREHRNSEATPKTDRGWGMGMKTTKRTHNRVIATGEIITCHGCGSELHLIKDCDIPRPIPYRTREERRSEITNQPLSENKGPKSDT